MMPILIIGKITRAHFDYLNRMRGTTESIHSDWIHDSKIVLASIPM